MQMDRGAETGRAAAADRVVVIGASAAGLFAAAAASGAGRSVLILERDDLADTPQARDGVPQGRQPHVFLYRGLLAAERLLPGLRQDLLTAGAIPFDTSDLAWLGESGWTTRDTRSFQVFSTSRPMLELIIRRRVAALPGVEIRSSATVTGLTGDHGNWTVEVGDGSRIDAGLVIDASGRNSRLQHWLSERFPDGVRTTEIDARIGYATRVYRGDPSIGDLPGVVMVPTPDQPTGGITVPIEGGRWLIGAIGLGEQRPPRDIAGFNRFLARLRDPALYSIAERLEPISDVMIHRQTGNRRRHYEELRDWPDGLLVSGDAFCAFNPVYGQGISVAALEAVELRDALRKGLRPGGARALQRRFAAAVELPWSIATGTDLRFATSAQEPTRWGRISNGWALELGKLSVHGNTRAAITLSGVYHLMVPTTRLLHPALIWAALRARIVGYGPTSPRPTGLPAEPSPAPVL